MRRIILFAFFSLAASLGAELELVSVKKIWDGAPHSAFGDLIRFDNRWVCVFREGKWHVARPGEEDDGKLRVITSKDGEQWESLALIAEKGIDLRDPHLSVAADGRLMIVAGGSRYPAGQYKGRHSRVMFSRNGTDWSAPQPVLEPGHWLWRVTWHKGRAYGVSKYEYPGKELTVNTRRQNLVGSTDGVEWQTITELEVPGGDETTLRFSGDRMIALTRRTSLNDNVAWVGTSTAPFQRWQWKPASVFLGGPNFIVLKGDRMIAGGRVFPEEYAKNPKTMLGMLTLDGLSPILTLPSGGDNSYPGFVFHDGLLWTMYYSSHQGKTGIYLAKVRVTDQK